MEHIGLRKLSTTIMSSLFIGASLNMIESIGFSLPNNDEVIGSFLAYTTEVKHLFFEITCCLASVRLLNAIGKQDSILTLTLDYYVEGWVADIAKLLECSKTLMQLTIRNRKQTPQDIILLADSLTVNSSVKKFKYVDWNNDQATIQKFLEQLKQSCAVEEVILSVSSEAYNDYRFLGDVEKCVQQINHIRTEKGVSSLLHVEIGFTDSIVYM